MKLPISWLKEYVDIDVSVDILCEKLVSAGFEVEEVIDRRANLKNVVVGRIEKIEKHPDADKLLICQLNVGKDKPVQIVTGAHNVFEGAVVPVALHDSLLPCGKHITRGMLRGVESCGMLCSGEELCVGEDVYHGASVDGITILDEKEPIGVDVATVMGLDDYILDINVTANRPDCGSIYGMAREVAVVLGKKCRPIDVSYTETLSRKTADYVSVSVKDNDLCPTYSLAVADNLVIEQSPLWLTRRLSAVGLRGINNLVDITNYVLTELGQPMHAFDYADITDKTIIVRRAKSGEKIIPLDNKEYVLNENVLVIADKTRAVGLAGIMGGANSGIKQETKTVAFESAIFSKGNVRRTSRELKLRSDSSARFEKGLDAYTSKRALARALHLVQQLNCGQIAKGQISIGEQASERTISFDYSEVKRLLGVTVPQEDALRILNNLDIKSSITNNVITCIAPLYRLDLERPCDIVEEIIRVYGYDKILPGLMYDSRVTKGGKTTETKLTDKVKQILCGLGYYEAITYSFGGKMLFDKLEVGKEADLSQNIRLLNPLGEELSTMRTTLCANMLEVCATNFSRNNYQFKLFEIGKIYRAKQLPLQELPEEINTLCISVAGEDGFYTLKDEILTLLNDFNVRFMLQRSENTILHPGISADIYLPPKKEKGVANKPIKVGSLGQVHPTVLKNFGLAKNVYIAELNLDTLLSASSGKIKYKNIPKFPSIDRDFAFVVNEETEVKAILDVFKRQCKYCESAEVFDVYQGAQVGKGKKSVAISVVFRGEQTLKDEDIEGDIATTLKILQEKLGANLR